jgi:hypothetical protein
VSPPRPRRSTHYLGRLLADVRSQAGTIGTGIRSAAAVQTLLPTLEGACLAMMNALRLGEIVMWMTSSHRSSVVQSAQSAR